MSAIDAIAPTSGSTAPNGFSALSSGDFAKIIFTELSKQDPLQPNDTNALLQQISSIRSIQSDMDLTDKLGALVGQNQFAAAATLLGKSVQGLTPGNARVSGIVQSVSQTTDGPVLVLEDGTRLAMSRLDGVSQPPAPGNSGGGQ